MDKTEMKSYWYYFCSLAKQFEQTTQYVDHSVEDGRIINGDTFSYEFAKILMLAASEFEVVAKQLCEVSGVPVRKNASIVSISSSILGKYPKIGDTEIITPYQMVQPLKSWEVLKVGDDTEVKGLDWWFSHNGIKHDRNLKYKQANLKTCIEAMTSLMVLEIYLAKALDCINEIDSIPCQYFSHDYGVSEVVVDLSDSLPDFPEETDSVPADLDIN